jgi:hypothetical protein
VIWTQAGETRLQFNDKDGQRRSMLGPDGKPLRGLGAGEFVIPQGAEGGDYVLSVRELSNRLPRRSASSWSTNTSPTG